MCHTINAIHNSGLIASGRSPSSQAEAQNEDTVMLFTWPTQSLIHENHK